MTTLADLVVEVLAEPRVRSALREALAIDPDEILTMERAGDIAGVRGRVVRDAGRQGELEIIFAGRSPRVRRSELDRWVSTRVRTARTATTKHDDPRAADREAFARSVERARLHAIDGGRR